MLFLCFGVGSFCYVEIVKESCGKKQGQYGLVIYGLSSIHDAKINNNIGLLKTQQYYLIP